MPMHRYALEFEATVGATSTAGSQAGWTEAWYDKTDRTEDAAATRAIAYKNSRLLLLSPGWSIQAIRISQLDASGNPIRKGTLIQLVPQNNAGTYPLVQGISDEQPWDAINISIQTAGGARRAFLMRGIAGDVTSPGGRFNNPAAWARNFPTWIGGLSQAGAGNAFAPLAVRTRTSTAETQMTNFLLSPVANVNIVVDPTTPLIRVPVNTVQAGNTLSIRSVLGMVNANGVWRAKQVQVDPLNNQFAYVGLSPRRRIVVDGTYEHGGIVRYWNWLLDNIIGGTAGKAASRRTGRPPQQLRGRRSNRHS